VSDFEDTSKSYIRKYVYDGQDILEELDGSGKAVAAYLHGPGIDEPLVMLRDVNGDGAFDLASEVLFYTRDQLGSVRDLTDISGTPQQRYRYSAYGDTTIERVQGNGTQQKFIENPFAYVGRELEPETGDYYYRARYRSPSTGRFLSQDPIGFASNDTNLYRYVFNSPLHSVDPSGLIGEVLPFPIEFEPPLDVPPYEVPPLPVTSDPTFEPPPGGDDCSNGGHKNNQRPSNREKHEKGDSRRKKDQGGEKGDNTRRPPRQRPPGWKGPWPPII
jgi:RHS repeat-associated protein